MFQQMSLRLRVFLFFALIALGGAALIVTGLVIGFIRLGEDHALNAFLIAGAVGVFAMVGLTTWVWVLFDENVARPVERLAAEMRARAHADVDQEIDPKTARYLGDLAPAAEAVATNLTDTRNAMAQAVGRETARLSAEKTRLEALLAEVPDGVLFCTPGHTIALYNGHTRDILGESDALGLGRPVAGLLRMAPIDQAYGRLTARGTEEGTDILVTTRRGARLLEARMRLLWLEGQETETPGYVLTLRDMTATLAVQAERAHLLNELVKAVRETLPALPGGAPAEALGATLRKVSAHKEATDTLWWPMEHVPAEDIGSGLAARLSRKDLPLTRDLDATAVRCDGFAIVRMLERLALDWSGAGARDLTLTMQGAAPDVTTLSLEATGEAPDDAARARWLSAPLAPGTSHFTGRDVLICHGTALTVEPSEPGRSALRLTLPLAEPRLAGPSRAVLYDFDLLGAALPKDLAAAPLSALSYCIFDTETTGLNPASDEVCQIAAVRVTNGKLVDAERFDMLVNPGRKIPAASTAVHHITDAMVEDAPDVAAALTRFHAFAEGCVLVAHNAPFDMAFLRRREAQIGARFNQPILDTVLCSAILYGQSADHTLDALCDRLHVTIPEADRHTAIGDALGTAEAFRKMIPMLEAADLAQLGALIKAFDRHSRLIEHLN